jgi:hypothetical protein
MRNDFPRGFPLNKAPTGFLPEQLFLADYPRWKIEPDAPTSSP